MKKFHENLLIVLALGLCALCAFQWYAQTRQRNTIDELNRLINDKTLAIQGYTNSLQNAQQEVTQLDTRLTALKAAAKTNELVTAEQKREIQRLTASSAELTNVIAQYKQGLEGVETKLKDAYDSITKQNAAMKTVIAQRDEFVAKYNDSIKERNDLVAKYNALVEQVEKMQAAAKPQK